MAEAYRDKQMFVMAALGAMVDGEEGIAADAIDELNRACGFEGLVFGMLSWLAIANRTAYPDGDIPEQLNFINVEDGDGLPAGADQVPAHVAWAGRLAIAKALDDSEQMAALINSLPSDWEDHLWAVLYHSASLIKENGWPK